jgi:hypothetical protein
MSDYKFSLGDKVKITISGEEGQIIGRAEYLADTRQYQILIKAAGGRAVTDWWAADFISAA